jgi:hypothetical protein
MKILFCKHQDVRTALGFETKTPICLANPVSDFLHCSRFVHEYRKYLSYWISWSRPFHLRHFLTKVTSLSLSIDQMLKRGASFFCNILSSSLQYAVLIFTYVPLIAFFNVLIQFSCFFKYCFVFAWISHPPPPTGRAFSLQINIQGCVYTIS